MAGYFVNRSLYLLCMDFALSLYWVFPWQVIRTMKTWKMKIFKEQIATLTLHFLGFSLMTISSNLWQVWFCCVIFLLEVLLVFSRVSCKLSGFVGLSLSWLPLILILVWIIYIIVFTVCGQTYFILVLFFFLLPRIVVVVLLFEYCWLCEMLVF